MTTTAQHLQSTTTLRNDVKMPWLGLGVFQVEEGDTLIEAIKSAIKFGYRSIDTAAVYGNEQGVGQAIREAIAETGIDRSELFITSKVWNADLGYEETLAAFDVTMEKLGLDYLDLYLIHWPKAGKYKAAWRALETLYKQGRLKAIGVSNFHVHHLEDVMADAEIIPMVDQVEYHPHLSQLALREFCAANGIQLEAWSPLKQGQLLNEPTIAKLADKYGKSVSQIIIRWDLQNGVVTIPKSVKPHRIAENGSVFDFALSDEDMALLNSLNRDERVGPDPDNFNF
ncbi:diketogulonate reductase-like aldo/keto reductase [Paenibacillus cellulosilyticus]|uniref:Diketogulonate reductase-like aldo/keto reductase n=1 Tax=Paenibacillus cellulosilyticus TaxID=375489 RepID=A0A2V2YZQ1_9BACL|nr:aldo/keto reductase [Paenibacillus cellulosilyticus]PWW08599.1 diketogulonate reductase-like aldo/keto reductase [Paenibacillus cellulosilyticus]QKS48168.1 aldo/keto reductase [Paenibacillus cellulosilyticus]